MLILGIDSSSQAVSAALTIDGKLLGERYLNVGLTHSQTLMVLVDGVLRDCSVSLCDVDALAVSTGPGSFTGIRIGAAAVKGMAFGTGKPVFPVSTLESMAYLFPPSDCIICPTLDARRGELYCSAFVFNADGDPDRLLPDDAMPASELIDKLSEFDRQVIFTGDGCSIAAAAAQGKLGCFCSAPQTLRYQRACGVCAAAYRAFLTGEKDITGDEIVPVYIRLSQAERERITTGGQ